MTVDNPTVKDIFDTMDYGPAPESAASAVAWLERHGRTFDLFIGGAFVRSASEERFDVINPATREVLARVSQAGEQDVDAAVAAARKAFGPWSALSGHARARYLYALARGVQRHSRLFAVLETLDNGKPIRETRDLDLPLVARHFYHHAGWAQLRDTELVGYESVGVCGQIIPWNFPLLMLAWKVAPALAMGNTVVLKPAEFTPLTALLFAELCQEVGLPPGVVNIVTGDGRTGELLVAHPDVDKLAFTGSTEVGKLIREKTAGSGKKLSLELGGKSPFIVFDDADLDSAVEGVVDAIWFNQGQVCCAGSRLLVQEGVAERMTHKLRERMERLRVGSPLDKAVDMGAIVAPVQLEKIARLVEQGKAEGATCYQPSWAVPEEGLFYPPTLFTNAHPASTVAQVEIFGPVIASTTFRTPAEAVELANHTRYGLAASVWTENVNLALDVAPKLKAGVVWINCTNLFDAASGFGGYKESGFGREGGREGLFEYLVPSWEKRQKSEVRSQKSGGRRQATSEGSESTADETLPSFGMPPIDRTPKLYIGGKQVRPDSGYSLPVFDAKGNLVGEVGEGNRKDVRNAVEAARKASGWTKATAHARAQVLYYLGENLAARAPEFAARLSQLTGASRRAAEAEVEAAIERIFFYAAYSDKYDGAVHATPVRNVTLAMLEPLGVVGVVCPDEAPLLSLLSLTLPLIALGNRVVAVPSERYPLLATDLYTVLDTSDVPGGVLNLVTGPRDALTKTLAEHDEVDALWYVGTAEGSALVERASVGNLKRTWVNDGYARDWFDPVQAQGGEYLRRAVQVKNIWVPYGE
ncbi:aldehyde dehydrogenase family protein [Truepera radiovictrix]|uniref:Aldehyde Dehydrogenase n=1 Tax=Truepera radiovictrix (strain DSM 17093 / CIP 108686 / LMG 22925 / RQ-24) TaxID=649638 RepID=D7CU76_TRURR|nr:aldehyde dehydrogenase family protein [Truepera radiovictrix]ADI13974.1 Aldehyde Dehydrogenase [Truepera radiovictrix DSM 17093]WMT57464.1 aldehyde dehydrogenase family protein [Truepera radiovictrix]